MKKIIFAFILGVVITGGISTYAITKLKAEEVSYNGGNVKDAIDELYKKTLTSENCVQGWYQLTDNATNSIGDKILDFAPSVFLLTYYDKNLPTGGTIWNGGTAYYNKVYSEDTVYWPNILSGSLQGETARLSKNFTIDNNLILRNSGWGSNQKIFYMACK